MHGIVWSSMVVCVMMMTLLCILILQRGKKSASNFDPEFTKEPCRLSPVDPTIIAAIEPEVFEGFSFTNPELYVR